MSTCDVCGYTAKTPQGLTAHARWRHGPQSIAHTPNALGWVVRVESAPSHSGLVTAAYPNEGDASPTGPTVTATWLTTPRGYAALESVALDVDTVLGRHLAAAYRALPDLDAIAGQGGARGPCGLWRGWVSRHQGPDPAAAHVRVHGVGRPLLRGGPHGLQAELALVIAAGSVSDGAARDQRTRLALDVWAMAGPGVVLVDGDRVYPPAMAHVLESDVCERLGWADA